MKRALRSTAIGLFILTLGPSPAFADKEDIFFLMGAPIAATLVSLFLFLAMSRISAEGKVVIGLAVPATIAATVWIEFEYATGANERWLFLIQCIAPLVVWLVCWGTSSQGAPEDTDKPGTTPSE